MRTLLLFFIAAFCITCKKYPEDDKFLELSTPKRRLTCGHNGWIIKSYLVNSVDSIDSLPYCIAGIKLNPENAPYFFKKNDGEHGQNISGPCSAGIYSKWEFVDKKATLRVSNNNTRFPFTPDGQSVDWEILELTKDELKLRSTINGNSYEIYLEK